MLQADKDTLEAWIDRHGMSAVLAAIAEICEGKADHVASNWQDGQTAKLWRLNGRMVDRLAARNDWPL